jgi:hypothetical protein
MPIAPEAIAAAITQQRLAHRRELERIEHTGYADWVRSAEIELDGAWADGVTPDDRRDQIATAQVYATLALASATRLGGS